MAEENKSTLGLADLRLLMDNYQNIVQMNAILLEQQKQVVDLQKDILKKEDDISKTQIKVCNTMNNVASRLDVCADKFLNLTNNTMNTYSKINDSILKNFDKVESKIESIHIDNTKEHSGITNKIYVGMVASGAAVVSLISLILVVYGKYEILSNIQNMVTEIFQKIIG